MNFVIFPSQRHFPSSGDNCRRRCNDSSHCLRRHKQQHPKVVNSHIKKQLQSV
jgi:hypothetical protein